MIEQAESDSDSEESRSINSQILLQESTTSELQESATDESINESIRASIRSNKNILTSTKFQDENFDKEIEQVRTTKMTRNINSDDEDKSVIIQKIINHPTREKQWEKVFRVEFNALIKNHI